MSCDSIALGISQKMCHLRPVIADSSVTVTASNYPVCVEYGYHSLVGSDKADDRQQRFKKKKIHVKTHSTNYIYYINYIHFNYIL